MNLLLKELNKEQFNSTVSMITELMNYHRKLNNAPKKYWQTDDESIETLNYWLKKGTVYNIYYENEIIGFVYIRFGGQNAAWLEDLFILEEYRGKGLGKLVINEVDNLMIQKDIVAMFVDVIPRNTSAIKLYRECGFNHLNMIELRKNYDKTLDKDEEIELLDMKFKKY